MRIGSWLKNWPRRRNSVMASVKVPVQAELLETRLLLSGSALIVGTELNIHLDTNQNVSVGSFNGNLLVQTASNGGNLQPLNSLGSVPASLIRSIVIVGGDQENVIDLGSVLSANFTSLTSISVNAGNGDDSITGSNDFRDNILGGDGSDTIDGQGGDDILDGGDGADSIRAGTGNDSVLGGDGTDSITGGIGNDTILAGNGSDTVDAGDGDDSVLAANGEDSLLGGNGNDTLNGDGGADTIDGQNGNDSLLGGDKNDILQGSAGNDTLDGQAGNDTVDGGTGDDDLSGQSGQDLITGGLGNDVINGNGGDDTLSGDEGNDSIIGGSGNDSMRGGAGQDTLSGQSGNDTLQGELDADLLSGGAGNDLIDSSAGVTAGAITVPQVSVSNVTVTEGNSGVSLANFNVTLSQSATSVVSVDFTTTSASATAGTDFVAQTATLTFLPGQTTQQVSVQINGDVTPEPDEVLFLDLSNPNGATLLNPQGIGTITNDESSTGAQDLLVASFNTGDVFRVDTATAATTRLGNSGFTTFAGMTTGPNGVAIGFSQTNPGRLFSVNSTTGAGSLIASLNPAQGFIEGDIAYDSVSDSIYGSFTGPSPNLFQINRTTGAITDLGDLLFGGTALTGGNINIDALAFRNNQLYAIIPDGVTGAGASLNDALLQINLVTREVTIVGPLGVDFVPGGASLAYDIVSDSFYATSTSGVGSTDPLYRINPTTGVATFVGNTTIGLAAAATFVGGSAVPPVITISNPVVREDDVTGVATFTVTLSRASTSPVTVQFATEASTAGFVTDFGNTSGTVTFAPGQLTRAITIPLVNDLQIEQDEVFFVRLTNPTGAVLADGLGVGSILNDDVDLSVDTLFGDAGSDTLIGGSGAEFFNGGADNDSILGGDGNDSMLGGAGNDTLLGQNGDDTLNGQSGADSLDGGNGHDTIVWEGAGSGNDVLGDTVGDNTLLVNGNGASNVFSVGQNASGLLTVSEFGRTVTVGPTFNSVFVNAGSGDDTVNVGDLSLVNGVLLSIQGGSGDDLLSAVGSPIGNVRLIMDGGDGNDTVNGGLGDETLLGSAGKDVINGGGGNDTLSGGLGNDTVDGGAGNDSVDGNEGQDTVRGGDGDDIANGGTGDDTVDGGLGNDTLNGNDGDDSLLGLSGNDSLLGGNGLDTLGGGDGDDTLDGGFNDDLIIGGLGNDKVRGDHGNDTISGDDGDDTINGGDGNDVIMAGAGKDLVDGADGDDTINGAAGDDILVGGDGNDNIRGGGGSDIVLGQDGEDNLDGQGGADTVAGNQGADVIADPLAEIRETFTLSLEILDRLFAL